MPSYALFNASVSKWAQIISQLLIENNKGYSEAFMGLDQYSQAAMKETWVSLIFKVMFLAGKVQFFIISLCDTPHFSGLSICSISL